MKDFHIYRNYTEAIETLRPSSILEVGPGKYIYPYVSLKKNIPEVDYELLDVANTEEDAIVKANRQIGGISAYYEILGREFPDLPKPRAHIMPAHELDEVNKSYDVILYVKSFEKLPEILLGEDKQLKDAIYTLAEKIFGIQDENKIHKCALYAYDAFVLKKSLDKANKVVVIPATRMTDRYLEDFFSSYGLRVEKRRVARPVWEIDGKEYGHWQDNTSYIVYVVEGHIPMERIVKNVMKKL